MQIIDRDRRERVKEGGVGVGGIKEEREYQSYYIYFLLLKLARSHSVASPS